MALHIQTFKTRALTALVFVAVMMAGLLWSDLSFFLLFTLVHFGAWTEYQKLVEGFNTDYKQIAPFHRYGIMLSGWFLMLYFSNQHIWVPLTSIGFWGGLVSLILIPAVLLIESKAIVIKNLAYSFFGILYISLSLGLLVGIRMTYGLDVEGDGNLGKIIVLTLIFSIWINDTMAYVVGSFIGKTPFSKISPKKTWEGTVGGAILCVITMAFIGKALGLSYQHAASIAAIAAIVGTMGDLFESKLKRMAGVKDSGHFMPGHGGFLDRFDSLLPAAIAVWFYMVLFM